MRGGNHLALPDATLAPGAAAREWVLYTAWHGYELITAVCEAHEWAKEASFLILHILVIRGVLHRQAFLYPVSKAKPVCLPSTVWKDCDITAHLHASHPKVCPTSQP
jgi:hypothetical protein